jgi:hypothetical protein
MFIFFNFRSYGADQLEHDTNMLLSFSDRVKYAGHDIHVLFVKPSDVKTAEVAKDAVKNSFLWPVMLLLAVQDTLVLFVFSVRKCQQGQAV